MAELRALTMPTLNSRLDHSVEKLPLEDGMRLKISNKEEVFRFLTGPVGFFGPFPLLSTPALPSDGDTYPPVRSTFFRSRRERWYSGVAEIRLATSRAFSWMLRAILRIGVLGQHWAFFGQVLQVLWLDR